MEQRLRELRPVDVPLSGAHFFGLLAKGTLSEIFVKERSKFGNSCL